MTKTAIHAAKRATNMTNVLVLDRDPQAVHCLVEVLARRGVRAHVVDETRAALDFVDRHTCAMAFVGLEYVLQRGGIDHDLIRMLRVNQPELPILVMAGLESLQNTVVVEGDVAAQTLLRLTTHLVREIAAAGCYGCIIKPLHHDEIEDILECYLPNRHVAQVAAGMEADHSLYRIVGKSPKMLQLVELAERIAPTSAPVLISGESGCGKELVAALIHHKSRRVLGPYVKVNCAALSDSLLESELFGHEKGAFTGAFTQRKGRFEQAHGGTLLLDEITETPPHFQAKLLRIIEEQAFERVGGNEHVRVNVRIISTTNRDLLEDVQSGRFRQDLYYRLSATRLVVPALRQRQADLEELVWHFVNLYARESQRTITTLDPVMMEMFANFSWPGNVRQLRNVVRTSLIMGAGTTLSLADVSWLFDGTAGPERKPLTVTVTPESLIPAPTESTAALWDVARPMPQESSDLGGIPLDVIERQAILDTLKQTAGNRKKAAEVLGISDRTLRERIRRYKEQLCLQPA
ncbi:sigma 54-interacting transcriptional regulator [Planctomycetota bacterium]